MSPAVIAQLRITGCCSWSQPRDVSHLRAVLDAEQKRLRRSGGEQEGNTMEKIGGYLLGEMRPTRFVACAGLPYRRVRQSV